jgi:GT2 family glycosyltransferase
VDSNSSDDSIQRAKNFSPIHIIKLTTVYNSAIARNIGAGLANGDHLLFLDGDMELMPEFIKSIYDYEHKLLHPLIGGRMLHKYYDSAGNFLFERLYIASEAPFYKSITGGSFIIDSESWHKAGGMDNRFIAGEDPELGLRLAGRGILLLSMPSTFVIHNTTERKASKITDLFRQKKHLFSNMLIYRKNIFNQYTLKRFWKHEKSLIALICSLALVILTKIIPLIVIYFFLVLLRVRNNRFQHLMIDFFYYIIRDISCLLAFIFFYPIKIKTDKILYEQEYV